MVDTFTEDFRTVLAALNHIAEIMNGQRIAITRLNAQLVRLSAGRRGAALSAMAPAFSQALDEWANGLERDAEKVTDNWNTINSYDNLALPYADILTEYDRLSLTLTANSARDAEQSTASAIESLLALRTSFGQLRPIFPGASSAIAHADEAVSKFAEATQGGVGVSDGLLNFLEAHNR